MFSVLDSVCSDCFANSSIVSVILSDHRNDSTQLLSISAKFILFIINFWNHLQSSTVVFNSWQQMSWSWCIFIDVAKKKSTAAGLNSCWLVTKCDLIMFSFLYLDYFNSFCFIMLWLQVVITLQTVLAWLFCHLVSTGFLKSTMMSFRVHTDVVHTVASLFFLSCNIW